ncbi:putative leader peptide [Streptomyces sp. NPDC001652]
MSHDETRATRAGGRDVRSTRQLLLHSRPYIDLQRVAGALCRP